MLQLSNKEPWKETYPKLAKYEEKEGSTANIVLDKDKNSDVALTDSRDQQQ